MKKSCLMRIIVLFMICLLYKGNNVLAVDNVSVYEYDLGIQYTSNGTTFKIWSSSASKIRLDLEDEINYIDLAKLDGNVWEVYVEGDLINKNYSYRIEYDSGEIYENVLDPYGKFVNFDGTKNIICDESINTFEDWEAQASYLQISDLEKIIYSVDVKNFTRDVNWRGTNTNRGKMLGLIESETKYSGIATGFDHIKSLGVTYVEISNLFDSKMPFAINRDYVVGGYAYSGNLELKQMVNKFYQNGIGVIAAVDLYDFSSEFLQNLNKIDREYYLTDDEKIDINQYMVQKYIKDLIDYLSIEYKFEGIKIENMGKLTVDLVNSISSILDSINSNIILYGDGSYEQENQNLAGENNLSKLNGVSMINGSLSYGLLGNINDGVSTGVLTNNFSDSSMESIKFALLSGMATNYIDYSLVQGVSYHNSWGNTTSYQLVNYITSAKGLSIHDKLFLNGISSNTLMQQKVILAYGTLMVSGGIPCITAGDEFLMSYGASTINSSICNEDNSICFTNNANEKQIDWSNIYKNETLTNSIKSLINFRKGNVSIIQIKEQIINANVEVYDNDELEGVVGFIRHYPNAYSGEREKIAVLFNYSDNEYNVEDLAGKNWNGLYTYNESEIVEDVINMKANSIYMAYKTKKSKVSPWISLLFVIAIIGGVYSLNLFLSKKLVNQGHNIKEIKKKYRPFIKNEENKEKQEDEEKDKE